VQFEWEHRNLFLKQRERERDVDQISKANHSSIYILRGQKHDREVALPRGKTRELNRQCFSLTNGADGGASFLIEQHVFDYRMYSKNKTFISDGEFNNFILENCSIIRFSVYWHSFSLLVLVIDVNGVKFIFKWLNPLPESRAAPKLVLL
jgi:hypothetical protein